ncbi:hypothetical protein AAC387_Pa08g1791 [Persea americana]
MESSGKILAKVIDFCKLGAWGPVVKAWDAEFVEVIQVVLFDLILAFRRRVRIEERNPHVSVSGERRFASSLSFRWHKCTRWELSTPQEMNFAAHVPTTAQASASEEAYSQDKIDSGS